MVGYVSITFSDCIALKEAGIGKRKRWLRDGGKRVESKEMRRKDIQTPLPMKLNMKLAYFAMTGGIWNSRKPVPRPKRMTYTPMMMFELYSSSASLH